MVTRKLPLCLYVKHSTSSQRSACWDVRCRYARLLWLQQMRVVTGASHVSDALIIRRLYMRLRWERFRFITIGTVYTVPLYLSTFFTSLLPLYTSCRVLPEVLSASGKTVLISTISIGTRWKRTVKAFVCFAILLYQKERMPFWLPWKRTLRSYSPSWLKLRTLLIVKLRNFVARREKSSLVLYNVESEPISHLYASTQRSYKRLVSF